MADTAHFERNLDARLVVSVIAAGIMSFAGVVVETAMNVTFPTLMNEFGIGTSTVQWITTGYLLVLSLVIPTSAFLKRRFPLRGLFITAICLFIAGTLACAFAPAFIVLLAGRLIQGVGTGIALPLMFNIVLEQAPLGKMGMMMGIGTFITATAPAVGPSVGGFIVGTFGWREIFIALLPVLVVAGIAGALTIRQSAPLRRPHFALLDFLLLAVAFSCFVIGLSSAATYGWVSGVVLGLFAATAVALVIFCKRSLSGEAPLLRVKVFTCVPFALSLAVIVLMQFVVLALGFLIPNYSQLVLGEGAFLSGCLLLPGCLVGACLAPLSGRVLDALGAKPPILFGVLCSLGASLVFCFAFPQLGVVGIAVCYLFFAMGQGFFVGNTMTNGLAQLPEEVKSDGNAFINTLQQLAGAVGTSVASTFVASAQLGAADFVVGTALGTQQALALLAVLAVLILVCSVTAFVLIDRKRMYNSKASC